MPKVDKNQLSLNETYKFYKNNTLPKNRVSYSEHKEILELWGKEFNKALLVGKDIRLYSGLSKLGVRKRKQFTYTDFKASKIAKKRIIRPNTHSGNYVANIYWARTKTKVNSKDWKFIPSRELSRSLSMVMKTPRGHTNFVERMNKYNKTAQKVYTQNVLNINL